MTATTAATTHPFTSVADLAPASTFGAAPVTTAPPPAVRARGGRWALWGAAAGVLGTIATQVTDVQGQLFQDGVTLDQDKILEVERWGYHVGVVAGIAATFCLLVAAAGWRRWAAEHRPDDLAARLVSMSMVASAGAMILGYGMKGALAVYLPGGMDEGFYDADGLYSLWMFLDFSPYVVWWGVCFAAAAMAFLALRTKALPRWVGVVSVPFVLAPVGMVLASGLPGFPGVVDGVWLTVVSLGLARRFGKEARA